MTSTFQRISAADAKVLKDLACKVAQLAAKPGEAEKRKLWFAHNALEPTRPLVYCNPENGWYEIIRERELACETEKARTWERHLRSEIFWGEQMCDDHVIEPVFEVMINSSDTGWGVPLQRHGGQDGGSFSWDPPIKSEADMSRLKFPEISIDREATNRDLETATELFGDVLDVRLRGLWWWSLGMTDMLAYLRGLDVMMMDMYENPELLHRLMSFLRDAYLAKLDFLEENDLFTGNHRWEYVGSGGFGYTNELPQADFAGRYCTRDMWGFCESQETTSVSADMFEEFVFPYQLPILERFGLNCYGCCEPLHQRWHVVKNYPRLRRISVSPWADLEAMAENLGVNYVYSLKAHPAPLSRPEIDEEEIRAGIRKAFEITRGCRVEIIMKDNHTIGNNPQNVIVWTRIAKEEAERASS